tara:strand:+ start:12424 stop:13473 length:1050 start_codon:yes stop_codon:yes gene_type:complete
VFFGLLSKRMDYISSALYYRKLGWKKKFDDHRKKAVSIEPALESVFEVLSEYDAKKCKPEKLIGSLLNTNNLTLNKLGLWYVCVNNLPIYEPLAKCAALGDDEAYLFYLHLRFINGDSSALDDFQSWRKNNKKGIVSDLVITTNASKLIDESIDLKILESQLSPILIMYILELTRGQFRPAAVVEPRTGKFIRDEIRKADVVQISPSDLTLIFLLLQRQIGDLVGKPFSCLEMLNVIRYDIGQEYRPHFDAYTKAQLEMHSDEGQRDITALGVVKSPGKGGSTHFPKIDYSFLPAVGNICCFRNCDENEKILKKSLHAGDAVIEGEKIILSQWFRTKTTRYSREVFSLL